MTAPNVFFSLENPLLNLYFFYVTVLSLKMMVMSLLTGRQRFKNKAFANPEDAKNLKVKPKVDDNVERIRRAHLNDLENILPFFAISFAYLATNPDVAFATLLFRIFTASRYIHTLVYAVVVVPQPSRAIAWGLGFITTAYMGVQVLFHFF